MRPHQQLSRKVHGRPSKPMWRIQQAIYSIKECSEKIARFEYKASFLGCFHNITSSEGMTVLDYAAGVMTAPKHLWRMWGSEGKVCLRDATENQSCFTIMIAKYYWVKSSRFFFTKTELRIHAPTDEWYMYMENNLLRSLVPKRPCIISFSAKKTSDEKVRTATPIKSINNPSSL